MRGGVQLRKLTEYPWHTGKLPKPVRLLVVSDLHNDRFNDMLPLLSSCDALLLPGDLADAYRQQYERAIEFLALAAQTLPTFVSVGNHDVKLKDFRTFERRVRETGAKFLFNTYERFGPLVIGGWYRPLRYGQPDMLPAFLAEDGCKVLLCHRPEDYLHHLADKEIDLVVAGHTHGGQWRIGSRGVYCSGQGIFPKFTRGVHGKMIISAGVSNRVAVPRIHNPREVLRIDLD